MARALKTQDIEIVKGKTFDFPVRWENNTYTYSTITGITKAAPAVVSATAHGVPDGWRVAVVSVLGMTQINAKNSPPKDSDFHIATVGTANALSLNDVNSSEYTAYTSGGYVQYWTPVDLSGFTARMSIKDAVGGTELFRLDTTNSRIVVNNTAKTITLTISATDTASLTFAKGVYDLELVSPSGVVTALLAGKITVTSEITTT
jgi:hypothetical protein